MNPTQTELMTFEVETQDFRAFEVEFAKLAKKAAKLHVLAPTFTIIQKDKVIPAIINQAGTCDRRARVVNVVTVSGQAPKLNGWTFAAALQHEEGGNIVRTIPGLTVKIEHDLRTAPAKCDHCNLARKRLDTYVVLHDDGRQVQVGKNCLKDFTGHDSPEAIARWAELLSAFEQSTREREVGGEGFGGGHQATTLDTFIPYVVASIRLTGWMSRTKARDAYVPTQATADHAWISIFPPKNDRKLDLLTDRITDADKARGAECLAVARAYFETNDIATLSDYEHNLRLVVEGLSVTSRTAGIAASLVNFAERLMGKEIERRQQARLVRDGAYVGTVGKREVFTLTCSKVIDLDSQFGVSHLHLFIDQAGNSLKWFSSTKRLEPGTTYSCKGTVKSHEEYKGAKQTMLSRCVCDKVTLPPG